MVREQSPQLECPMRRTAEGLQFVFAMHKQKTDPLPGTNQRKTAWLGLASAFGFDETCRFRP